MFAAETRAIRARRHWPVHLGRDDYLMALRHLAQPSPGDLFARAERVDVSRVVEVDTRLDRGLETIALLVHSQNPVAPFLVAVAHASEADARDGDSGLAQFRVLHDFSELLFQFSGSGLEFRSSKPKLRRSRACVKAKARHR